jgi:hypothetical protein
VDHGVRRYGKRHGDMVEAFHGTGHENWDMFEFVVTILLYVFRITV